MINKNIEIGKEVIFRDGSTCEIMQILPTCIVVGNEEGSWPASLDDLSETLEEHLSKNPSKYCSSCEQYKLNSSFSPAGVYCSPCSVEKSKSYAKRKNVIERVAFKNSYAKPALMKKDIYLKA